MLAKLRRRFIIIAMLSVFAVLMLVSISVNVMNFVALDSSLSDALQILTDNRGSLPPFGEKPPADGKTGPRFQEGNVRDPSFNPEFSFSTRFFVLTFDEDGSLIRADLDHIAAVDEEDMETYLDAARQKDSGYIGSYKYRVAQDDDGTPFAIFLDCRQEQYAIRSFALITALVDVICLLLVYLLVVFFSKRAIDPVIRGVEKQKQFITDASHELKTPLTVINTSLKVLEMEVGKQKWIDKALLQTAKMRDLVQSLVTLSRLDEEKPALNIQDFSVSEAVEETAESFRESAEELGKTLVLDIAPGLSYHGDEYSIRQLVSILMDNAVKYASPEGEIRLSLRKERRDLILQISNPCEPLSKADLDNLFERFYRADKSRTGSTGGFGIGLSIARSITEAHRGTIKAADINGNGIRFTAVLR